ncbi:MAG: hypothetical protein FWF59_12040 [Turicibacter sp.]|nr:hypothetical protein [Turicibacter sp.]
MTSEQQEVLRKIIEVPYKIGHILGFRDLTELQNEWLKLMLLETDDVTLLAHRGSCKSTCLAIAIALLMIIRPNQNIIFIRKTDDDVKETIKQVSKSLESEIIQRLTKIIYGVEVVQIERSTQAITTNLQSSNKGHSQLLGLGIKTSMTGKHADFVFTDDIVNTRDRFSKAERDLIKLSYMELENIKNRGGRIFNTGTPWHKEDAISMMPNVKRYDCYETGLIERDKLEEIRRKMTPSLFSANYELKHIADVDAMFTNPNFFKDGKLLLGGNGHIDASYSNSGDGTAYTLIKKYHQPDPTKPNHEYHGKILVFGKRWNRHIQDCMKEVKAYHEQYQIGTVYMELNSDKGYSTRELRKIGIPCKDYHENTNKFVKISTYLRQYWDDIYFLEATDMEYINEILDYTEQAEHDDSPDSLASILRELWGKSAWLV